MSSSDFDSDAGFSIAETRRWRLSVSLAQVLPENLNRLLIVVVIVSMVLTPALASLGDYLGDKVEAWEDSRAPGGGEMLPVPETDLTEPVVILGFNQAGQVRHASLSYLPRLTGSYRW